MQARELLTPTDCESLRIAYAKGAAISGWSWGFGASKATGERSPVLETGRKLRPSLLASADRDSGLERAFHPDCAAHAAALEDCGRFRAGASASATLA